jgi:hypothetical protein
MIKRKRKPNGITKADSETQKSENLTNQGFAVEKPNEKRLSDITEIPCPDGKLCFATVLDCHDGKIVGHGMDDNMRAGLCGNAFEFTCCRKEKIGVSEAAKILFSPGPSHGLVFCHNTAQTIMLGPLVTSAGESYIMDYGAKLYLMLSNGRIETELHYKQAGPKETATHAPGAEFRRKEG